MSDRPRSGSPLSWDGTSDKGNYYRLFGAYAIALFATGIATVALSVLAFDLAGYESGSVVGTALSLKMLAYVVAAPLAAALTERLPRRTLLVALDLIRAGSLFLLPFVTRIWQIYALVFVFALASATFVLAYQAIVPYLLRDPKDYTQSLARSRIASDLETSISPLLAAGLLLIFAATGVFLTVTAAFLISAILVQWAVLPQPSIQSEVGVLAKTLHGPRLFLANSDLRALLAIDVAIAIAAAMVMVNTVVLVEGVYNAGRRPAAIAFAVFGIGSIAGALSIPLVLRLVNERLVMLCGAALAGIGLVLGSMVSTYYGLLVLWFVLGLGVSIGLTPASFLIRRLARAEDLQSLFAAQFSISNGCLLFAYPAAGWLGAKAGMPMTFIVLAIAASIGTLVAAWIWRGATTATS